MLIGGIEAGGTKMVCAVGNQNGKIITKKKIATYQPEETMQQVKAFFSNYKLDALGVGSFGPIDLDASSSTYGMILNSPKEKWRNFNFFDYLKKYYKIPVYIDTDVNTACLGEYYYGSNKNINSCLYITVGTGIGAGFVKKGKIIQGKNHSEMGHIYIPKLLSDDNFRGVCPYHSNCLESLASGTAIEKRHGEQGEFLTSNKEVWEREAHYLSYAIANFSFTLTPEQIILGGGVMKQKNLYFLIRKKVSELINNYIKIEDITNYIVPPSLNDEQGVRGAIALAFNKHTS